MQRDRPSGDYPASAGVFAVNEICGALGKLYIQLSLRQHFLTRASRLSACGLVQVPVPQRLFKVRLAFTSITLVPYGLESIVIK